MIAYSPREKREKLSFESPSPPSSFLFCLSFGLLLSMIIIIIIMVGDRPVHSYVLMEDGTAKYLCEVVAGDKVER